MLEVNQKVGRWTVLKRFKKEEYWKVEVLCDCGKIKEVREWTIKNGESSSCGCYAGELAGARVTTHGLSKHTLFSVWYDAHRRCYDPKRKDYVYYGQRGISFCERWKPPAEEGFKNFLEDMFSTHQEGLELDRANVDGNYEPSNCRWVTRRDQVINRRPTGSNFDAKFFTHEGKTLCLSQWADEVGLPSKILVDRLGKLGWEFEKAINSPARSKRLKIDINGELITLKKLFQSEGWNFQYFANYKTSHTLQECCEKFITKNTDYKVYGEYSGEDILLYEKNISAIN